LTKLQLLLFPTTTQNSRKRRKAKPMLYLCDLLLLHRAWQVHSKITHMVARQAH